MTKLDDLQYYLQSLTQLQSQGVRVIGEINAVMDAINKELGIEPKWRSDDTEKVIQAATDFVTACEKMKDGKVTKEFLDLREAVYKLHKAYS